VLASSAFRDAPHAVVYVHCAKLREVDTTAVLEAAMADRKRCARLLHCLTGHRSVQWPAALALWGFLWSPCLHP
jgi:hypothetical protein